MLVLPPEILITVIDALTCNTQSGAYTHAPEVKKALHSLALIVQLVATLSGATPHAQSLAKRIHSLRLVVADSTAQFRDDTDHLLDAISLLRILAGTLTIQRLFMDTIFTIYHGALHNTLGCLTSLSELTLLNREHQNFFWDMELGEHQYDCLLRLQVLTVGDVTIDSPGATDFLLPLVNLKELVLIRPWANGTDTDVGSILAGLFAPHRALQHLILVLAEGQIVLELESLTLDDLGPAMVPHLDKVDIFSERELEAPRSWTEIRNMVGMGHRWAW
ncbi:hypothetical protein FRB95_002113 [Tulasnella sp. JGI-2019a]|nr:hypothetical protein FRB95_002113 [Tulasnella sp. JGI-2019a]